MVVVIKSWLDLYARMLCYSSAFTINLSYTLETITFSEIVLCAKLGRKHYNFSQKYKDNSEYVKGSYAQCKTTQS